MPRQPKPWRRGGPKGAWYAQVQGKQVWLAPPEATKTEAHEALTKYRGEVTTEVRRVQPGSITFRVCVNEFLEATHAAVGRGEKKPLTLEGYARFLLPAAATFGRHPVVSLRPYHVSDWLDAPRKTPWNTTTRNNAITAVKACLNWAKRQGYVTENPVRDMEKPRPRVTEADMTPEVAAALIAAARDRPFRDFMEVMFGTGARPSEAMALEAKHVDFTVGVAVLDGKTTGRTGTPRVIQIGPVSGILTRLAKLHPAGPLLRNSRGEPWTRHTIAHRFKRLRKRLGLGPEATAKGFRHGFATDGLDRKVPIATVAELLGHKGTKMVEKHYSKLRRRMAHLKEAADTIRPGVTGATPAASARTPPRSPAPPSEVSGAAPPPLAGPEEPEPNPGTP